MKRLIIILFFLLIVASAAGCGTGGSQTSRISNQSAGVSDVLKAGMAQADGESGSPAVQSFEITAGNSTEIRQPGSGISPENIDIDLTVLSSTMVYSEVYAMLVSPEDYIGKTVKMDGLLSVYHDESSGTDYFACIIQDATACCAQGIEFNLAEDYTYPDDYPEAGSNVCVAGVFDTYQEGKYTYCTLRDAVLIHE